MRVVVIGPHPARFARRPPRNGRYNAFVARSGGRVTSQGIGASVKRKEDARHLQGRGSFVADMKLPGLREVAFLRSWAAHGRIARIGKPARSEGSVFVREDLAEVADVVAGNTVPG